MPGARGLALGCLLAASAGWVAAAPTMTPSAPSASLRIDTAHSETRFVVNLRLGLRTQGRIPKVSGEMTGDALRGWQVLVVADGTSLVVKGPRWMDRATRSPDFLDIDHNPEIRFHSTRFTDHVLHAGGSIGGKLTLRGLTRPVSFRLLPSACAHPGRDCDMQVSGSINRKDFGMTAHPVSVRDDVQLSMRVRLLAPAGGAP